MCVQDGFLFIMFLNKDFAVTLLMLDRMLLFLVLYQGNAVKSDRTLEEKMFIDYQYVMTIGNDINPLKSSTDALNV